MPDRWLRSLRNVLVVACCAAGVAAMAAERRLGADGPPLSYRLDDVRVSVKRQYGHGQPTRELVLAGTGQAVLQVADRKQEFEQAGKDLLAVLNGLYRIGFFEMPAQLRRTVSVYLGRDGVVGTQALKMSDAGSTTVCFALPGYEKCVRYEAGGPREMEDFVQGLLTDAEQRALPPAATPPAR